MKSSFVGNACLRLRAGAAAHFERLVVVLLRHHHASLARPQLLVVNHLSWFDAIVLFAVRPITFVTSTEIRDTPFLGWVCKHAGCLFVERRRVRRVADDQGVLVNILRQTSVAIFPEGTSSNGETVAPFKPAAFAAALQAGVAVTGWTLAYPMLGGKPFSRANHHHVCWYGYEFWS